MYKAVVFDLDGTLLDTTLGVIKAVELTIEQLSLPMPSEKKLLTFVGPPMQLSFEKEFGLDKEKALDAANIFRRNYKENSLYVAELYPGVLKVLDYLKRKGYKIMVATNKSHDNAISILKYFAISNYCDFMMGADLEGKLTKANIIEACLTHINIEPQEAIYVGDSIFDLEGAEKVGVYFIGVTYGFGFRKEADLREHNYVAVCHNLEELCNFL